MVAYVLDLSVQGITAGVLRCAVEAIRVSLAALAQRRNGTRVGVTMVDVRSHFLCLRGDRVCDVTLADYEEAFPPLAAEAWLTEVTESTLPRYWRLLDHVLRTASSSSTCTHSVLPAALKAVAATLKTTGGQILLVQTAPAIGEGVSPIRETVKVYGSTEEQALYAFPPSSFLETLTHLFLAGKLTLTAVVAGDPANFFHLAALETLVSDTGGRILFRPAGNSPLRAQILAEIHGFLQLAALAPFSRGVSARLRLSSGLHVLAYHGGNATDLDSATFLAGGMDDHLAVVAELDMDRYVKPPLAHAQFAVLFFPLFRLTSSFINDENECCVRVFNRRFPVVTDYAKLYRGIDQAAVFLLLTRGAIALSEDQGIFAARQRLQTAVATLLAAYRNTLCRRAPIGALADPPSPLAQLTLPETLALLPLLLNNLLKSPLLAMTPMNAVDRIDAVYPRADLRVFAKWVRSLPSSHPGPLQRLRRARLRLALSPPLPTGPRRPSLGLPDRARRLHARPAPALRRLPHARRALPDDRTRGVAMAPGCHVDSPSSSARRSPSSSPAGSSASTRS